jgi:hypothetical protein
MNCFEQKKLSEFQKDLIISSLISSRYMSKNIESKKEYTKIIKILQDDVKRKKYLTGKYVKTQ